MHEATPDCCVVPALAAQDTLGQILRIGAQRLLIQAVEQEVAQWIDSHQHLTDEAGHRQVVRNGRLPKRTILTGVGPVEVQQPRDAMTPSNASR